MKPYKIFAAIALAAVAYPALAENTAQETTQETDAVSGRVAELTLLKDSLEQEIGFLNRLIEKRIMGKEESERISLDSTALELSSQLVDVELELNELVSDKKKEFVIEQFNLLNKK